MPVLPVETSAEWARAAILLGSNHESRRNLRHAVALLARFGRIVAVSPVYQSEDVAAAGTIARAPYLNAALVLETTLSAAELKFQALRPLEAELGRLRDLAGASDPAAPVPIDLDLALYDDLVIDDPALGLRLPHPDILLHRHAAQPLADILPDWRHPVDGRSLATIAADLAAGTPPLPAVLGEGVGGSGPASAGTAGCDPASTGTPAMQLVPDLDLAPLPPRPLLLQPDNFTPPTRTPWGGTRIAGRYKRGLGLPAAATIGESWELSVEPSFPSRVREDGALLADHVAAQPVAWLGEEGARACGGQLPLLLKLLDAGEDLSVQVHPAHDDPRLGADESGKPEAWIIVDADPGAGLFLGWRDGVARADVEHCLARRGPLERLLNFVPVAPGQVYDVPPGTPHAIGKGVTVVEPQYITPGKRGVTYRFFDWDRRYAPDGRPDPAGRPRELHEAQALDVTDWQAPTGAALVARCRQARPVDPPAPRPGLGEAPRQSGLRLLPLIQNRWFGAAEVRGTGRLALPAGGFRSVLVLEGHLELVVDGGGLTLAQGDCAAVPAATGAVRLEGRQALAIVAWPWGGG